MEPRPQRPRAPSGQPTQQPHPTQAFAPGEYPEGADPTAYIAPARTEYDYSPLDLAPPGQRRRRQLVAAAVGGLSVVLLGAIIFFSFLLLRDEKAPSQNDDLLAAQTQVANAAATVSANQTVVAQAAFDQTAEAQALNPDATTEPTALPHMESAWLAARRSPDCVLRRFFFIAASAGQPPGQYRRQNRARCHRRRHRAGRRRQIRSRFVPGDRPPGRHRRQT